MRFFFDTEFMEEPGFLQMLSIGIVAENGAEYYAVNGEANLTRANPWVKENVLPHLDGCVENTRSQREIGEDIRAFCSGGIPQFWGYFADYDWVLFCWLQGRMVDLPPGWPMYCLDVRQLMDHYSIKRDQLPREIARHHALEDAKWTRDAWTVCRGIARRRQPPPEMGKEGILR